MVDTSKTVKSKSKKSKSKSKKSSTPVMHVSRRKYVSTMMNFNKAMYYRPYVLRVCTSSHANDPAVAEGLDPGKTRCVFSSKLPSSKKRIDYFVISHMDHDQSGPMLKITPYLPSEGPCIKQDRVPLEWIRPTSICPHKFYGMQIRCPRFPLRYLDLTQPSWRLQKAPRASCKADTCQFAENVKKVHALCQHLASEAMVESAITEPLTKNSTRTKMKLRKKKKLKPISESV